MQPHDAVACLMPIVGVHIDLQKPGLSDKCTRVIPGDAHGSYSLQRDRSHKNISTQ